MRIKTTRVQRSEENVLTLTAVTNASAKMDLMGMVQNAKVNFVLWRIMLRVHSPFIF